MLTSPEFKANHHLFTRDLPGSTHMYLHKPGKYEQLAEEIRRNRRIAMEQLGYGERQLYIVRQVHGANVQTVTQPWEIEPSPTADAMVTNQPGKVLGILTADCVPVLFADTERPVIGAAHAGWKGARAGVIEATLAAMEALGAPRSRIEVLIGACIHQASYEVGPEFYANFDEETLENRQFFIPSAKEGHYRFDLSGYVTHKLRQAGIKAIHNIGHDTCAEEERFFSYRRCTLRGEPYGANNLSVIML
jgi:YfiH family protein